MTIQQTHTQTTTAGILRRRRAQDTVARGTRDAGTPDATRGERLRADAALVALWAALAVAILAVAIAREIPGALVLGVVVIWLLRVAWVTAARPRDAARLAPIRFD